MASSMDYKTDQLSDNNTFDFGLLCEEFKKCCTDFGEPIQLEEKSNQLEFAIKILFKVGPEYHILRKSRNGGDKSWKSTFCVKDNGKSTMYYVSVVSYKPNPSSAKQPVLKDNKLTITVRQAGLLAMKTFNIYTTVAHQQGETILTPLAGAVFSKPDIKYIAKEIEATEPEVIQIINSSCQTGGEYLTESRIHVAAVAAKYAVKNLRTEKEKTFIYHKIVKRFENVKKREMDVQKYEIYDKYAARSIGHSSEAFKDWFEKVQLTQKLKNLDMAMLPENVKVEPCGEPVGEKNKN